MSGGGPIPGSESIDPGLLAAFLDYEDALRVDDVARLDAAFAPGNETLRGDAAGLLVGHDAISDFRSARGGIPPRRIVRLEARTLTPDAVLLVSVSRFVSGGDGLQTQLWQRTTAPVGDGAWRISAAHVTGRAPAFDRSVWRELGDPLVAGAASGPLAGLTVAVKDLFALEGHRVGAGNPAYLSESAPAAETAPAIAALLAAGASVRGIARTDEFAYSIAGQNEHYGTPPNARVIGALPGGSSSGPTSAVALGQADIGVGTDTAGSIRIPASYQGLWGLRTTHGSVDADGLVPLAPTFDTIGWLTRDASTLRAVVVATLGETTTSVAGFVTAPASLIGVEQETRAAFDAAAAGLDTEIVELPAPDDLFAGFRGVQQREAWGIHGAWVDAHPGVLGADIAARFDQAREVAASGGEGAAREVVAALRARIRETLGDRVLIIPSAPGPAPQRTGEFATIEAIRGASLRITAIAGIAGLPALSVPVLETSGGPVGLCLVGPVGSDLALVDLAVRLFPSLTAESRP